MHMTNRMKKYKGGEMNVKELVDFKDSIDLMTDEELDTYLNSCGSDVVFADSDIDAIQKRLNKEIRAEKHLIILYRIFKSCAAVLFPALLLCGILLLNNFKDLKKYELMLSQDIIIETDNGESSMTILPDGSRISMGPKSKISYNVGTFNSENREIRYSGEGRFSIAKNPEAPFKLFVSDIEIKVLGTVFSIYARENKSNTEIHLEKGSLQLASFLSNSKTMLCPGETAIINRATGKIEIIADSSEYKRTVGLSIIYFKSSSMSNVAKELEMYYGKSINMNNDIKDIKFTGSLPTNNIEQVLFILENTLNISTTETDGLITFYR